jgi:hypothetical protein
MDDRKSKVLAGQAVVANRKTDQSLISWAKEQGLYVFIGRPSKWGNPFFIGMDGNRDEVCDKYAQAFVLHKDLHELRGKVLGCWCYPERCHGDFLVEVAR